MSQKPFEMSWGGDGSDCIGSELSAKYDDEPIDIIGRDDTGRLVGETRTIESTEDEDER